MGLNCAMLHIKTRGFYLSMIVLLPLPMALYL